MEHSGSYLLLPLGATSRVDVGRLLREAENLDEFMRQAAVREPGQALQLPKTSKLLDETLQLNKLNALQDHDRKRMIAFLIAVKEKAPMLHVSFNGDPSPLFVQKLMTYLRREIHPLVLVQLGLQPAIGAGCVVRTTNKYFDFSLREHFKQHRDVLIRKLTGTPDSAPVTSTQEPSK
jgi:F0F1-type ATP synthase delta subunit